MDINFPGDRNFPVKRYIAKRLKGRLTCRNAFKLFSEHMESYLHWLMEHHKKMKFFLFHLTGI